MTKRDPQRTSLEPGCIQASGREPTRSEPLPSPAQVWICTYENRYGLDPWAAASVEAAYSSVARRIREFWQEAVEADRRLDDEDRPPLPEEAPAEDREAVERYFEVLGEAPRPEFYSIERQAILGG
jgi:hypothetical protein